MKNFTQKYRYKRKRFIRNTFNRVEYLKSLECELYHDLLYKLETRTLEPHQTFLKERDPIDRLTIIEFGCLELYTEYEGTEFVLEKLYQGSVLNYRMLFLEEVMKVNVRASEYTTLLELSLSTFEWAQYNHPEFDKKV